MKYILLFFLLNTFDLLYTHAQSGDCNVNIQCEEGNGWTTIASSVVKFGYGNNSTGTLINNTRKDRIPYILTCYHCISYMEKYEYDSVYFLFNFQSNSCKSTTDISEIDADTLQGMELVAYSKTPDLDFALIRLKQEIPEHWNIYFAGWTTSEIYLTSGVGIHHPSGDIKKISTSDSVLLSGDKYWNVLWKETTNGYGVTETGSSGSALFNYDSLIIGILSSGYSSCTNPGAYDNYIRFSLLYDNYNSDTNSLKQWLDPDNTGITMLKGINSGSQTAINVIGNASKLIVYPNPCRDILHIQSEKLVNAHIYNNMGQLIFSVQKTKSINTSHIEPGIYWLQINGQNIFFCKMD